LSQTDQTLRRFQRSSRIYITKRWTASKTWNYWRRRRSWCCTTLLSERFTRSLSTGSSVRYTAVALCYLCFYCAAWKASAD